MTIKRYEIFKDDLGLYVVEDDKDGIWVKYEDIESLVKDAMRYRWLREQHKDMSIQNKGISVCRYYEGDSVFSSFPLDLDAEIDNLISKEFKP